MGQHFLLHRDLVAATAVHHTALAHMSSDVQPDLVVTGPQYLRIYRVEPFPTAAEPQAGADGGAEAVKEEKKNEGDAHGAMQTAMATTKSDFVAKGQVLHLIDSFPLAGVAESIQVLHFDRKLLRKRDRFHGGQDVLLLSFARYKWVVVGYDRRARSLATLAMYSFADDAIGPGATLKGEKNGRDQLLGLSTHADARVDPQTRCGAMLIYSNQLVVVPFRSGSMELSVFEEDDEEDDDDVGRRRTNGSSSNSAVTTGESDDDDDDDEEEKKLQELVNETKQRGATTADVNTRLMTLLDKSVKIGTKRKRNQLSGLLTDELTGREFLLRLPELEIAGKVIDLAFLDGYLEPTLMILHEENEKNATEGRFASGYDTYCLTVISINLNTRLHPKIWSVKNLPSDCFKLIPCKAPIGGVIVLSANAFLYFNQTQFYGLATNVFASETVNQSIFPLQDPLFETMENQVERLNLLLYDCQFDYLGHKEIVLTMSDGALYVLTLPFEDASSKKHSAFGGSSGGGGASGRSMLLSLRQVHHGAVASCICVDEAKKTIFLGSRSGDSVLYAYNEQPIEDDGYDDESMMETSSVEENGVSDGDAMKVEPKLESEEKAADDDEDDEDDLFLYGSAAPNEPQETTATNGAKGSDEDDKVAIKQEVNNATAVATAKPPFMGRYRYELRQIDVLPGIGQITSIELGIETNADSNEKREELVISGGDLQNGAISVLHNGLRPIVGTEAELNGCRAMWTVSSSLPEATKSSDGRTYNSYLILSVAQRTMVLRTGEGMEPLEEDSGFYTSGPTLAAANLFNKQRIVQIFKQGARVMTEVPVEPSGDQENAVRGVQSGENGDEDDEEDDEDDEPKVKLVCTQEITLEGDVDVGGMNVDTSKVGIVSVDIIDPYILILLTDGSIRLLMGDEEDMELTVIDPEIRYEDGMGHSNSSSSNLGISSVCLFYDWTGMFRDNAWGEEEGDKETQYVNTTPKKRTGSSSMADDEEDDEMDSLYSTKPKPKRRAVPSINNSTASSARSGDVASAISDESASIPLLRQKDASMMCGLCYEDGSLHVFSLPDFTKKGVLPYLTFAPQWLVNTMEHYQESEKKKVTFSAPVLGLNASSASANDGRIKKSHTINSPVADIAIHRIGPSEGQHNAQYFARMVLLVFLANGDLLMYAATPKISSVPSNTSAPQPISFQFARVGTDLITRPFLPPKAKAGTSHNESGNNPEANTSAVLAKLRAGFRYPMLTRFDNVNNMSGAFFRGAHPMWILSERGLPSFVPMCVTVAPPPMPLSGAEAANASPPRVNVPVLSFTPFYHWNCRMGLFISTLAARFVSANCRQTSTLLSSSGGFVLRKAEFGATIHHMLYLGNHGPGGVSEALETPTFAVVCSTKMKPADAEKATENENEFDEAEGDDGDTNPNSNTMAPTAEMFPQFAVEDMAHTEEDVYELRLVQTNEFGDWERNGVFRVYFERYEVILSFKVMYLYDSSLMKEEVSSISQEWHKRKRPYVVIGTGYVGPHGEDESGRGRLLLYELDYAQYVNHSGSTSGKLPKLRLVFIKEHRQGAISMVSQLGPYVIAAVGSKLIVYEFKSEQLIGCAFYDAQMFIVSISIVKDFIMYGDIYKSVHFLRWKEKQRQLVLLAKDYEPLAVSATEFNLFEKRLALLAVDMEENLHVMQFAPNDIESRGGQRLLRTGDFHLGVQVSSMFRKLVSPLNRSSPVTYVNILGSSEGGISALIPVSERVFRRLFTLQNVMINTLPQNCALNPRDFRTIKTNSTRHSGRLDAWSKQKWKKSFLDAHVLFRFLQLDYVAQKEITRCIGTTPEVVIHNLLEVQRSTSTFL
uniref:Cleavage/polyadenylation specificity factor A subunit C-terminal domain-containing protein n=1 Tax=Globisporangium ultimum (strain ATCC 200006 / CBS 805.95 / DAOM BR144) TaxID=431595 RepID=K3WCM5_GLOUD